MAVLALLLLATPAVAVAQTRFYEVSTLHLTFMVNLAHLHAVEPCFNSGGDGVPPSFNACFVLDGAQSYVRAHRTSAHWDVEWPRFRRWLESDEQFGPLPDHPTGPNTPPTVTVEGPWEVVRGESVELVAVVVDPDEYDSWSYQWTLLGGSEGTITGADTAAVVYASDPDGTNLTEEIAVAVSDYRGGRVVLPLTITVTEPPPPADE